MFMLRKTHEAAIAGTIKQERYKRDIALEASDRALTAERSISASLRAEIEELRPLADKYTARLERDRAHAANKRKARP